MAPRGRSADSTGMTSLADRWATAKSLDDFLAGGVKHAEIYRVMRSRAVAPVSFAERIAATGRQWHLLVLSEEWCNDAVNLIPWIEAMVATSSRVDLRFLERDRNLDLMDQHLTNGSARAIPIVLVLDDQFVERGWWGPRPREMQRWTMTAEAQSLTKEERYKELRARYARDRGVSTMEEITQLIERAAQALNRVPATSTAAR